MRNVDQRTVSGFGEEWSRFDQSRLAQDELREMFDSYFRIFPWSALPQDAEGFDAGCGSGRWAACVAPRVGTLHCVDASEKALAVARNNLEGFANCAFHLASVDDLPFGDKRMDFGYSLGVLHHVPDTLGGLRACARKLKPGAPFLVYLYYAFDNRPGWYRLLWRVSDWMRRRVARLPFAVRYVVCQLIAVVVCWPLARIARLGETLGVEVSNFPLSYYRKRSLYTIRTDTLDRFGTALEKRFTADEVRDIMALAGLERVEISTHAPYWCAVGYRNTGDTR